MTTQPNHLAEAKELVNVAWDNYGTFQMRAALAGLNLAIEKDPTLAEAFQLRGNVKKYLGRLPDAALDFSKAVLLDPDCPPCQSALQNTMEQLTGTL